VKNRLVESKVNKCTQGNATKYYNIKTHIWKGKKIEM
jgi:predicted transcriptional regulator